MSQQDLAIAYKAIVGKQELYNTLWKYYDGDHPLIYSQKRLEKLFQSMTAKFVENWMAVVIDSILDRLRLKSFTVSENEPLSLALNQLWQQTEMNLDNLDAHLAALVIGEAFIIVWPDVDNDGIIEAYYNDPRMCHAEYEQDNPHKMRFAAKWFCDEAGYPHITLYYPDTLEYYKAGAKEPKSVASFQPEEPPTALNPYGEIPVFHLRRERRKIKSELENVITIQDAINKLFADMMVAAEFGAFPQRYVISQMEANGQLKNAPNEIWQLWGGDGQSQDTEAGQFEATNLDNYLKAMDRLAQAIAIISKTPKHFFFGQGGDPSGEALIAMEAPLNDKALRYIERFRATWKRVGAFMMKLSGQEVDPLLIEPVYEKPQTVQPYTLSLIRKTNVDAGMPLVTVLREEGKDEAFLAQLEEDKNEAETAQQQSLAAAVIRAQAELQAGQQTNGLERPGGGDETR
jgi:hypothetical protein